MPQHIVPPWRPLSPLQQLRLPVIALLLLHQQLGGAAAVNSNGGRVPSAAEVAAAGMEVAQRGSYREAVPFFQRTVQLEPSATNWNNLGVTHMRLGDVSAARDAYLAGHAAAPGGWHADCDANLRVLDAFIVKRGLTPDSVTGKSRYAGGRTAFDIDDADGSFGRASAAAGWMFPDGFAGRRFAAAGTAAAGGGVITGRERRAHMPRSLMQHTVLSLPHIALHELYTPHNRDYARGWLPFVLTHLNAIGTGPSWGDDLSFLTATFPDAEVDFYPSGAHTPGAQPEGWRMTAAAADLLRTDAGSAAFIRWNLGAGEWRQVARLLRRLPPAFDADAPWMDACLPTDDLRTEFQRLTHWRTLTVGAANAGVFLHADFLHVPTFVLQLAGTARWAICHPSNVPFLGDAGAVDAFAPNYTALPAFRRAACYDTILHAGDALYFPADYWYQSGVEAAPSVALVSALLPPGGGQDTERELAHELARRTQRLPAASPALRAAMRDACFPAWLSQAAPHESFPRAATPPPATDPWLP